MDQTHQVITKIKKIRLTKYVEKYVDNYSRHAFKRLKTPLWPFKVQIWETELNINKQTV